MEYSKKNTIFCSIVLSLLVLSFASNIFHNTSITSNISESIKIESVSSEKPISSQIDQSSSDPQTDQEEIQTILGDLSDFPEDPALQFNFYRNKILEHFNMTLSDYYSLTGKDLKYLNDYVYALWGYENGTLTIEMAEKMTEHNTPRVYTGFLYRNKKEQSDGFFKLTFNVKPKFGERVVRVRTKLDRDESLRNGKPVVDWSDALIMQLHEVKDPFKDGKIDGHDWVGRLRNHAGWGYIRLDATITPGFLDSWVEVWVRVTWDKYNFWRGWVRQNNYYKVIREVIVDTSGGAFNINYGPLAIYDDDTKKPILDCYIVDEEDLLDTPYRGFKRDPKDPPIQIEEGGEYRVKDGQYLFFVVDDDTKYGEIQLGKREKFGEFTGPPQHQDIDCKELDVWTKVYWWFGLSWYTTETFQGQRMDLSTLGGRWEYSVRVDDRDNDRENDNLISDEFNFVLYSDPDATDDTDASIIPIGAGNIIQDADGIYTDQDFYYQGINQEEQYDVIPFKKDTTPSELSFDLTFYNDFEFPIRLLINYTQFENDERLMTGLNTDLFNIVKNGTDGRYNYYEGFSDINSNIVEENDFAPNVSSSISEGLTGKASFWIELLPEERVVLEDFLTIKVKDFHVLTSSEDMSLPMNIKDYLNALKDISTSSFDLMSWSYSGTDLTSLGDEYQVDELQNLFDILIQNPVLFNHVAKCHFGIRAEKIYYPQFFNEDATIILWNKDFVIEDRTILDLVLALHADSDRVGFQFDEDTGFNHFRYIFVPNDEQFAAFNMFLHQINLRDSLLYLSSYCDSFFPLGDPMGNLLEALTLAVASGLNSLIYPIYNIMMGLTDVDSYISSKPNPQMMTPSLDLFPELTENNEFASITHNLLVSAFSIERELRGYLLSMCYYEYALEYEMYQEASNHLLWAHEFLNEATLLYESLTLQISKFLAALNTLLIEEGFNPFSDTNIQYVRDNFFFDSRYSHELLRQADFRSNDANDNKWQYTSNKMIQTNDDATIQEISLKSFNSAPFFSFAKNLFTLYESNLISEYVKIQKELLSQPGIQNMDTETDHLTIHNTIEEAVILFKSQEFERCIDLLEQQIRYAISNFTETLNDDFFLLYLKATRLAQKAQNYNQIDLNIMDCNTKTVMNGKSAEFLLQIHNDIHRGMDFTGEVIAPLVEALALPSDVNFKVLYLNNSVLPGDFPEEYYLRLNAEEFRLVTLLIELPINSPYELTSLDFLLQCSHISEVRPLMVRETNFSLNILEDDTTAPIILLSYTGYETDGNPGYLDIEIIEDDLGSEATGILNISGPNNYKYLQYLTEDSIAIDLKGIGIYTPGYYSIHIYAENNDEDRGAIDEESDMHYSSIFLTDDDTTAPLIDLSYDGIGTDQDPGILEFSITDNDEGSEATAILTIEGPMNFEFIQYYGEGAYQIDLSAIGSIYLGTYDVSLYAENNDEDGWEGDEESDIISLSYTIIDDDVDSPEVTIEIYDYYWEVEGELVALPINVTAVDYSGISKVEISMGSYYSDELGYQIMLLPEGIYTLEVVVTDNDNDRPGDMLNTTKTVEIILDLTPPTTELVIDPFYDDGLGNYYVTSATCFSFEAFDEISGVDFTKYRILGETEWRFAELFTLSGYTDGIYLIEFYSVDNVGNVENVKSVEVNLVSIKTESYLSDEVDQISSFDLVFRKYKKQGYMLVATNPGQIFYNVELYHNWPIPIEYLEVDMAIPSELVTQGTNPIHIYRDGEEITEYCIINGFTVKIFDIAPGCVITIIVHMDYGLKGTIFESLEDVGINRYSFESILTAGGGEIDVNDKSLFEVQETDTEIYSILKGTTAIAGCITDEYGVPLQGFEIILKDAYGNIIATTFTDENGFYCFNNIDSGNYIVEVRLNGIFIDSRNVYATSKELTEVDFWKSW